jgi:alanyl-tRNA synthetase
MAINNGRELRAAYSEYFRTNSTHPHPVIASAPIIPPDDPTLMFTSAGMVQFKPLYSGTVDPMPYRRAASCQKCLRAGGKGSDLENVGKTLRHHTFFEMLGNFSFGDYFKEEAIRFAWEFCTSPQWMNLPRERMFATIFGPTEAEIDREAEAFWAATDLDNPIILLDAKENFWGPAGDTGACGPCSEIKFFMGTDAELEEVRRIARRDEAGRREIGKRIVDEGDLFLEIWNLVFPQFDQQRDGSRPLLKNRGIDTGAGLERMTAALTLANQLRTDKAASEASFRYVSQYKTDIFAPITRAACDALGFPYAEYDTFSSLSPESQASPDNRMKPEITGLHGAPLDRLHAMHSVNAIADHARTLVFCLSEGITPSNLGRGYVVRRIARRALRFASLMGRNEPFMADLYDSVVEAMGETYPEIKKNPDFIKKALRTEEETFLRTLDRGQKMLDELLEAARANGSNAISGADAFKLWDTFGFPFDLTREIAEDAGIALDEAGYEAVRKKQKEDARASRKTAATGGEADALDAIFAEHGATAFEGYSYTPATVEARVLAIIEGGASVDEAGEGEDVSIILDRTPFYAESGGQIGDAGVFATPNGRFIATDTVKTASGLIVHRGRVEAGALGRGETVEAVVDRARRHAIVRHHSTVHLMQNALKRIVGDHVTQAGSYVGPEYCRFDFSHSEAVTTEQIRECQALVNELILEDHEVTTEVLPLEEAKRIGAIAPFGEKYAALVRVVRMGPSVEFCGGTHLQHTSQAGSFRIVSESSVASGVRRIEAVVGSAAVRAQMNDQYDLAVPLQLLLAARGSEAFDRVQTLAAKVKDFEREVAGLRRDLAANKLGDVSERAVTLADGAKLVAVRLDGFDGAELRPLAESLRQKLGENSVTVLISAIEGRVALIVASGKTAATRYPAGKVVNAFATPLDGKGGGKPDMAQAGARKVEMIDDVITRAAEIVASV